ncbi:MAG: ABC transporter substrate-binding protein [Lachnospiraceae bacterium]|nr:ABC transporter substrate-binding protein [Lachnospiraceae bacterium]
MKKTLLLFFVVLILSACTEPERDSNNTAKTRHTNEDEVEDEYNWKLKDNRETLIIGTYQTYRERCIFRKPVFDFNMSNSLYQIEIKEYEDSSQLNKDIIAGKAPDIIWLPPNFMMDIYAIKGVLVDLNPLLDNDPKIKRADLQENILAAFEVNGQLFGLPLNYRIETITTGRSQIGGMYSWTLDEMMMIVNEKLQLPEIKVFEWHYKSSVLYYCLLNYTEILVGENNGGIFDRDLYIKILNFANQFTPDHLFNAHEFIFDQTRDGQVQFCQGFIDSVFSIQELQFDFGEPVVFLGYPTEENSGNIAYSDILIAINQNCDNQEVAWSFISSMLTEEYQINAVISQSLPIRKSALERNMRNKIMKNSREMKGTDVVFESHLPTEDEKQQLRGLIESVTKIFRWDARMDILREEALSFLNGAKSAEEAADVAANRVEIYVNEMR